MDADRKQAVSAEAVRLYREEPDLFRAASKEYEGNYILRLNICRLNTADPSNVTID